MGKHSKGSSFQSVQFSHRESTARNAYKCGTGSSPNAIRRDVRAVLGFHQCVRGCSSRQLWVESVPWDVCPSNPFRQRILTFLRCPMETQRADFCTTFGLKTWTWPRQTPVLVTPGFWRSVPQRHNWSKTVQGCMELAEDHVVRGLGGVGCIKLLFGPGGDVCFFAEIPLTPWNQEPSLLIPARGEGQKWTDGCRIYIIPPIQNSPKWSQICVNPLNHGLWGVFNIMGATDSCFVSSIYHQPGDAPCEDRALWHIFIAANEDQQLRGCRLGTSALSWWLERRIGFLEICFMITPARREH